MGVCETYFAVLVVARRAPTACAHPRSILLHTQRTRAPPATPVPATSRPSSSWPSACRVLLLPPVRRTRRTLPHPAPPRPAPPHPTPPRFALQTLHQSLALLAVLIVNSGITMACSPVRHRLVMVCEFISFCVLSLTVTLSLYFLDSPPELSASSAVSRL